MFRVLVEGYIREFENNFKKNDQIFPKDVKLLCLSYYYTNSTLICIVDKYIADKIRLLNTNTVPALIYCSDINTNWNYSKGRRLNKSKLKVSSTYFAVKGSLICGQKNVKLPKYIANQLIGKQSANDVIFKADPNKGHCDAFIFDENDKTILYHWTLEDLPTLSNGDSLKVHGLLYSNKYGLICVAGQNSRNIYNLSFNTEYEYKYWKLLPNFEPKIYDSPTYGSSCCIIHSKWFNDKYIFINGGFGNNKVYKTTKLYDMDSRQWINLKNSKYSKRNSGIFFDKISDNIYISGGYNKYNDCLKKFEKYDINKNKWTKLPNSNFEHGENPLIWKQYNGDTNILYIASAYKYCMESIDLRTNKWTISYDKSKSNSTTFDNLFTRFSHYKQAINIRIGLSFESHLRLLRFNDN